MVAKKDEGLSSRRMTPYLTTSGEKSSNVRSPPGRGLFLFSYRMTTQKQFSRRVRFIVEVSCQPSNDPPGAFKFLTCLLNVEFCINTGAKCIN